MGQAVREEGLLSEPDPRGNPRTDTGHKVLQAHMDHHARAPEFYYKHVVVDPVIVFKGDKAYVESYFAAWVENPDGPPFIRTFGRYKDVLSEEEGRWAFLERVAGCESIASRPRPLKGR